MDEGSYRARRRATRDGPVNARRKEPSAVWNRVDAPPLQQVARQRTDVRDIDDSVESDIALDAEAEVVDRRRIVIASNGEDARRADAERRRQQVFDRREVRRRRDHVRRRFDELQHLIVVETVVKTPTPPRRGLAVAEDVGGEPDARADVDPGESNTPLPRRASPGRSCPRRSRGRRS